jgi:dihydroorotate dehydrogenase
MHPFMAASGTAGHGAELSAYGVLDSIGAIVVKSIAATEWAGNPAPRVHPIAQGMINAVGLQGLGVQHWIEHDLPAMAAVNASAVVSIWGRSVDEYRQAAQLLQEDEMAIALNAYNQGVNPAEVIYSIAKERGYNPAAQTSQNNGQSAEQKILQTQKGMQASKSLSNTGGKTSTPLSLEALAEMDDESFDKYWSKVMQAG